MPDKIEMNMSLFVHILLDSEGQGLWGVQGNTFVNTVSYFNQYIGALPKDADGHPIIPGLNNEKLSGLSTALIDLARHEAEQKSTPNAQIDDLITQTSKQLLQLNPNTNYMLPGGWQNKDGGHAMIYQFHKMPATEDSPEKIRFSIYNAGAGIDQHEKSSTTKQEIYSPVQVYEIPTENLNPTEFKNFIHRLIVPRFVDYLDPTTGYSERKIYNAEKLYRSIEESMPFLNDTSDLSQKTQLISGSTLFPEHFGTITTAGQISGTCAQRSIHQMLKVNFDTLQNYQRFIVNFEIHALKELIYQPSKKDPQKRSPDIIKTIDLGIDNLLKILQEPDVFTEEEKIIFHLELNQLRKIIQTLVLVPTTSEPLTPIDRDNAIYQCRQLPINDLSKKSSVITAPLAIQEALPPFNNPDTILNDIQTLLARCQASFESDPPDYFWIINQIDQIINRLPIPSHETEFQEGIEPYKNLIASELKQMEETLLSLQKLYVETMKRQAGEGVYPNLHITQCSFLALQDYFSTQYVEKAFPAKPVLTERNPHTYLKTLFHQYFNGIYHSPHFATNNPIFDQRFTDLRKTYSDATRNDFSLMDLYQALLDSEPACKDILEKLYNEDPASDDGTPTCLHALLIKTKKEALYCLFNHLGREGNILSVSQLKSATDSNGNAIGFTVLSEKIQTAIRMEKGLFHTFSLSIKNPAKENSPLKITKKRRFSNLMLTSYSNGTDCTDDAVKLSAREEVDHNLSIHSHKYALKKEPARQTSNIPSNEPTAWPIVRPTGKLSITDVLTFTESREIAPTTKKTQSANNIQIESVREKDRTSSPLNKDDFFMRRLKHLRLSPPNQIRLTLNYFMQHMDRLSDFDNQCYVEANLFEPGLFNAILRKENFRKESDFLKRFDAFIQKGFNTHNEEDTNNITIESLFFVRLNCYTNRYMLEHAQAFQNPRLLEIAKARLTHDLALINDQITVFTPNSKNTGSNHLTPNNISILASLHEYRFLTLMSLASNADTINFCTESQEQLLESYFYLQSHENTINPNDKTSIFERQRLERIFQHYLQQADKEVLAINIKKVILNYLQITPEKLTDFEMTGTYPHYTLTDLSLLNLEEFIINAEQGRIFKDANALINVPLEYSEHPLLKRLGIEKATTCFISTDGKTLEFVPVDIRIKKYDGYSDNFDGIKIIQKKWPIDSKTEWYDLQPINQQQRMAFAINNYKNSANLSLPTTLQDADSEYWVNVNNNSHSFIAKKDQRLYEIIQVSGTGKWGSKSIVCKRLASHDENLSTQYFSHDTTEYYLNVGSEYHPVFSYFESLNFLEINLAKKEDKGTAYLPRYGLSFELHNQKITLSQTRYSLDISEPIFSPFKPEIAQLTLTDTTKTDQTDGQKNQLCIVPVQRFYFIEIEQTKGHRSYFMHDTSNHIATHQLKDGAFEGIEINHEPQWSYLNSAENIQFPMINGKIKPNNAADALYLCYLYLGSHEPDKAWTVLEDIRTRLPLEGNYREITYLSWIMNALPVILKDDPNDKEKTTHQDATLGSPCNVACQLKALALYTDFLAQGKKPKFPDEDKLDLTTANGHYEKLNVENVKTFYNNLPDTIYQKYSELLKMREHLSESYTLQDTECKSLLKHFHQSLPEQDADKLDLITTHEYDVKQKLHCHFTSITYSKARNLLNSCDQDPTKPNIRGALGYEYRRLSLKTLITEQERLQALLEAQQLKEHQSTNSEEDEKLAIRLKRIQKRLANIQQEITQKSDVMKCETQLETYSIDLKFADSVIQSSIDIAISGYPSYLLPATATSLLKESNKNNASSCIFSTPPHITYRNRTSRRNSSRCSFF